MSDVLDQVTQGLVARGIPMPIANGVTAGIYGENAANTGSVDALANSTNSGSGAFGIGQWLGARKQALFSQSGTTSPSLSQQLDYLTYELKGGDYAGKQVLGAADPGSALNNYITKFMRPAPGHETTRDLIAGNQYLANNKAGIKGTIGDAISSFSPTLGNVSDAVGKTLAAPGDLVQSGAAKLLGGLDPSGWFQRIALAILAILLIGIALSMLAGRTGAATLAKSPVPLPV